uniref:Na(+)/H(+) exchange regulatory cofactor NHE-RF n=1 Tax=Periophthalmus magnuspinnatus TaxID=409849 RepID=A0A3B4AVJ6_9GOBI
MDGELRPRLCFLTKGERGYGFHLHGERNKGGQFIRKVEPGSCADLAGLRAGDRVVEVNGENVENATHHEVVSRIREVDFRTRLLVVDRETEEYLHSRGLTCTEALAIEMGTLSPRPSPAPTPSTSPIPPFLLRELEALSPKTNRTYALSAPTPDLLPRLCHLLKSDSGYGFNLHSKKKKAGQFVRSVDPGSPAEQADIRPGDRIVEVNGLNVDGLKHSEVVTFIRAGGDEVQLLVVDQETDELFKRLGITPTTSHFPLKASPQLHLQLSTSHRPTPQSSMSPLRTAPSAPNPLPNLGPTGAPRPSPPEVPDEDDRCVSDPFAEGGLRLSPTAAEARKKAVASRNKKRAPPMDWSKKKEIFSNY